MALSSPIEAFLEAARQQNQNRQQAQQDAIGAGQGLANGIGSIAQMVQNHQKKQAMQELLKQFGGQPGAGQPTGNPGISMGQIPPSQPMTAGLINIGQDVQMQNPPAPTPMQPPQMPQGQPDFMKTVGLYMRANPEAAQALIGKMIEQKRTQPAIDALMNNSDISPQMKSFVPLISQYPELAGQIMPELLKNHNPKIPLEWFDTGRTTKDGKAIYANKASGEEKIGGTAGNPKPTFGSTMAPIRQAQYTLQDLPSNQGPSTAGGAAYQVLVGSQQGMNLIAKAGSAQRTGLAQGDLARTILRNSPTDEALKNANFSDNVITHWSQLKQKLTNDPAALANPKIRKEMYDIFSEMRTSAKPFISNQLDDMESVGFKVPPLMRKRQMGETLPVIPYQENIAGANPVAGAGWSDSDEKRYQDLVRKQSGS